MSVETIPPPDAAPVAVPQAPSDAEKSLKLVVFAPDAAESAQIRRIRSYLDCGFDVTVFSMRRANMNEDFVPFWNNIHLYETQNESPLRRLAAVAKSVAKVWTHRGHLAGADVLVARNLDMLAIAAAARRMLGRRPALIYECLDIHSLMTDPGAKGRATRAAERRLLAVTDRLIVSSPAFVREYFAPVQSWTGPVALIENKMWIAPDGPGRPAPDTRVPPETWSAARPLVLGWVGTLRCARSLTLLAAVADQLGPAVHVALHGVVHRNAVPDFDAVLAGRPNMSWHGPYAYPDDLRDIYTACDLVWAQDLWQWGTNSTWLLPNRIYEASYFGCPSLAVAGTETGRRVQEGLGWTIPAPEAGALSALLKRLSPTEVRDRRTALLARPENEFRQEVSEIADAIRKPFHAAPVPGAIT